MGPGSGTSHGSIAESALYPVWYNPAVNSPFPGMDPFLEAHWEDIQPRLTLYIRDELAPQLPEELWGRNQLTHHEPDLSELRRMASTVVTRQDINEYALNGDTTAIDEPILLEPAADPLRQRSILIYDPDGNRSVTAIEILSPWNKSPGNAVRTYLNKRKQYINSETNLVEIDLVRAGNWTEMIGPFIIPPRGQTTYRVTVVQPELTGPYLYPIPLSAKLPTIKVPLRPQDAPAKLNLQELIEKAYVMGKYHRINYTKPCSLALVGPEKEWVDKVLESKSMGR